MTPMATAKPAAAAVATARAAPRRRGQSNSTTVSAVAPACEVCPLGKPLVSMTTKPPSGRGLCSPQCSRLHSTGTVTVTAAHRPAARRRPSNASTIAAAHPIARKDVVLMTSVAIRVAEMTPGFAVPYPRKASLIVLSAAVSGAQSSATTASRATNAASAASGQASGVRAITCRMIARPSAGRPGT